MLGNRSHHRNRTSALNVAETAAPCVPFPDCGPITIVCTAIMMPMMQCLHVRSHFEVVAATTPIKTELEHTIDVEHAIAHNESGSGGTVR